MELKTAIEYGEKAIKRNSRIIKLTIRGNGKIPNEVATDLELENTAIRTLINTVKGNVDIEEE